MKRLISLLIVLFFISISSVNAQCCNSNTETMALAENVAEVDKNKDIQDIKAYYFHLTRRCTTCKAVEKVSGDILKDLYGSDVTLKSVNVEEKEGKELAQSIGISGQALVITNGEKTVNLINDGFMYARTNPAKLKEKIEAAVESVKE
ncbi:MAG: hypothetical protein JXR50_02160 [Prolixibacteraceae bacterium]|nr:hypothetical protein [Prolixibacteraceae bacterium]MBN2648522.1 hypothetical protein [Prolixibacteraceae bacterium]